MLHRGAIILLLSCLICAAADKPPSGPSQHDLKAAQKSFEHALKLQKQGRFQEAFAEANHAVVLVPANMQYLTTRELLRTQVAGRLINDGNLLAEGGNAKAAESEFKQALAVDPQNGYAEERLRNVTPENPEHEHILQMLASVEDVNVNPKPGKQSFHVRGDTRDLYEAIGRVFGIVFDYDQALTSQRVRFDVDNLDFYTALKLAGKLTHTFWAPVSSNRAMVANDNQEMRRQYERLSLQTFYVSNVENVADLNDVVNILRNVFEVRLVSISPAQNTITVRAPKAQMAIISAMLDDMIQGRPEVLIDIKAFELNYDKQKQSGLALQNNFTIFNVYSEIYKALGPSAQTVINQLQQTGTIDPSKIPIGTLSTLQGSPLLQPFIFFGKGYGLTGINVSPISGSFSSNSSSMQNLEHVTMRASNSHPATLTIGTRFPIQLASFTNVSISQQGLPVVGSATPQIQYEDLGLTFKATPHLQTENNVNLEMQLEIKGLGAAQLNGVPVITNRSYSGSITVKDGEPSVVAGVIEEQTTRSANGYPVIGALPFFSSVLNTNSRNRTRTEVLVVITPHIIRKPYHHLENILWDPTQQ